MIDQLNNKLDINNIAHMDADLQKTQSNNSLFEANFDDLIAMLNATMVDSLTALSINNANKASKTEFVPSIAGNIGSFAATISSDGKLSSPSIKQAPLETKDNDVSSPIDKSLNNNIKLGKSSNTDL